MKQPRSFCSFYIPSNIRHHSAVWFPPHALAESVLALTMVARCLRCHKMYEEEGGGGCYYHPGTHRGDSHYGRTGLMCGWSCCKVLPPTRIPSHAPSSPQLQSRAITACRSSRRMPAAAG